MPDHQPSKPQPSKDETLDRFYLLAIVLYALLALLFIGYFVGYFSK
jgi:nitrate reductase NapE component